MTAARKRGLLFRLTEALELPKDVALDLPRTTIMGDLQLAVENHKGIVEYSPEEIRIAFHEGQMVICGEGLTLTTLYREEIIIDGRINAIYFQ
ncbi:MAG: sporulation protein YqfC [Limnochordia bacterium]|jgi:sporulation protein YqfC